MTAGEGTAAHTITRTCDEKPGDLWNETQMMLNFGKSAGGDVWGLTAARLFQLMLIVVLCPRGGVLCKGPSSLWRENLAVRFVPVVIQAPGAGYVVG